MVMEVIPSAAGKSAVIPAKHRTRRIGAFLARISGVLPVVVCLFIPRRPHSVGAEHLKGDTAAPKQFFHGNLDRFERSRKSGPCPLWAPLEGAKPRKLIMNRRRDGGSEHFLAALTMRFALKMSAKMVASALA